MKKIYLLLCLFMAAGFQLAAQTRITGMVTDKSDGTALPGVTVRAKGTTAATATDASGKYVLSVPAGATTLTFSYTGYVAVEGAIPASGMLDVMLESGTTLEEVVISVGSRNTKRTLIDSPLPVDILTAKDLNTTGQTTFDKALQYRVPSFNTVNTPVNDATTLLDPYEIRNMGPSRTLILVDGKRKNLSSLLYVQFSPGRGETGADISAIPIEAIKRVEILRDGASAQYGSDAIAGVMNIILKDRYDFSSLNLSSGVTSKGDGDNYGVSLNSGSNFGDRGYINYTIGLSQQNSAVRSGIVDVPTEIATFGDPTATDPAVNAPITSYLAKYPTANNINGTGDITAAKFLVNAGIPMGETGKIYANAAYVTKKVSSFANYRTPYWKQDYGLLHAAGTEYIGYVPTFEGDMFDYNATLGMKDEHAGWNHDVSMTIGGNQQLYTVNNTVNHSLQAKSPTSFKTGGFNFHHIVGNVDISKALTQKINFAFGSEARTETYQIFAGDTASYSGQGSNSFPGITAVNATTNSRYNIGAYADLSLDITKNFLINGTYRVEKYSDFGNASVGKISSRLKLANDKIVLRGSASTGFRAPTLHQIYAQSTQAAFVGGTIQLSGLFNNNSVQARLLGIPSLKPEKSTNFSGGIGLNLNKNLSISLDAYYINVKDRIVYSSSISSSDPNSLLGQILSQGGVKTIQFFINGIETNTGGLDYVASYRNIGLGSGKLGVNLAGNFTLINEIVGTPNDPEAIKAAGATILNSQIKSLLTESRPKYKTILGFDYAVGKFGVNLNNTLFGTTAFQDLDNGGGAMNYIKQEFKPAVVTDLMLSYNITSKTTFSIGVNNLFNTLPKWDLVLLTEDQVRKAGFDPAGTGYADAKATLADPAKESLLKGFLGFSGRYNILGYNGSQFSQLGSIFNANLNLRF